MPDECKFVSELGGYTWLPPPSVPIAGVATDNGGGSSNGGDEDGGNEPPVVFEFLADGYGLVRLSLLQLRAYVERFEAVLDGSSAFRAPNAKFEAANTATEEAWRHIGAALYHPYHTHVDSADSPDSTHKQTNNAAAAGRAGSYSDGAGGGDARAKRAGAHAVHIAASALVMLSCDLLHDVAKLPVTMPEYSPPTEITAKFKKWSIVGRGATHRGASVTPTARDGGNNANGRIVDAGNGDGADGVRAYAAEFNAVYHAAAIAGVLPEGATIADYEAKYKVVLKMASALMWQRRWKLAHHGATT